MAGIVFYFEYNNIDVWSGRDIDLDAWNYAIKAAGDIDTAIVVNKTDKALRTFDADMKFSVVSELPTAEELGGKVVYVCCPWDTAHEKVSIWDFNHDVDWYVFGPANGWRDELDFGVYIPLAGQAALHSMHVASVILTHRFGVLNGGNLSR